MSFLSLAIETSCLTQEKDQLEYQEMIIVSQYDQITQDISTAAAQNLDTTSLEAQQQYYDSQKSSIESQLKNINAQIEGYQKATDTNIKSECKFSVSV